MWVDRKLYDDIRKKLWETTGTNVALEKQVVAQQSTIEWMAMRLTQVEHEKAQLLFNYTGVKVETPIIRRATPPENAPDLNQSMSFDDVGDEIAKKMGITHNPDGSLCYSK